MDQIRNAFCRLVDGMSGAEIARNDLTGHRSHTGILMGKMFRAAGAWHFETIGQTLHAQDPVETVPQLTAFLP